MIKEKPLDIFVGGYSNTSIFRTMAFIGDSLSSGEFEIVNPAGNREYHDMFEYSWGQFVARKNGLFAYNFSQAGMTSKWYLDSFAEEKGYWDKDKACQAYVIALGVNDIINQNMIKALYALAEHFDNSYVIDLYKYGPVYGEEFRAKYFMRGHMNPMGYIFTANLIDSYIDYIIRTNPSDFEYVGFIGRNIKYK